MALMKKMFKFASQTLGEILVLGGAAGTIYTLGFLKGVNATPEAKEVVNETKTKVKEVMNNKPISEAEVNEEPVEEETESTTPPIEVTTNQPED